MDIVSSFEKELMTTSFCNGGTYTFTKISYKVPDDRAILQHIKRFCIEKSIQAVIKSVKVEPFEEIQITWCCISVPKKAWKVTLVTG